MNRDKSSLGSIREQLFDSDRKSALDALFTERRKMIMASFQEPASTNNNSSESMLMSE